ncbi:hypothetical protein PAXRUDRAFT_236761 [Paxillus rubicundulus Ve08.2h10]|uniref:Uncharacterized protein n=1 Tax=Paxillus rubicundulus Ve08.2h10 TaxID=930991 RepID=A0A0D0E680_9AGAM|nr:hypothetical protein PAXRUDRAFT_236761 [Paxillus rubicundulus Ve08.2h10]
MVETATFEHLQRRWKNLLFWLEGHGFKTQDLLAECRQTTASGNGLFAHRACAVSWSVQSTTQISNGIILSASDDFICNPSECYDEQDDSETALLSSDTGDQGINRHAIDLDAPIPMAPRR